MERNSIFRRIMMCLAFICLIFGAKAQNIGSCTVTVQMHDLYGDGWNGARLIVEQNGNTVASLGFGQWSNQQATDTVAYLTLDSGTVSLSWVSGDYDNECSFSFLNTDGEELFSLSNLQMDKTDSLRFLGSFTNTCINCPRPQNIHLTGRTTTSLDLAWDANGVAYIVEYYQAGSQSGSVTSLTSNSNSLSLTGLTANTPYSVSIRSICSDGDTSNWNNAIFFTECDAIGCDWKVALLDDYDNGFDQSMVVVMHPIGIVLDTVSFSQNFWQINNGHYMEKNISYCPGDQLFLKYFPRYDYANSSQHVLLINSDNDTVSRINISDFGNEYGQFDSLQMLGFYIDTFSIFCPSCIAVNGIELTSVDTNSATISWQNTNALSYLIEWGTEIAMEQGGGTRISTTDSSITFSGLSANTQYRFVIAGLCADNDTSQFRQLSFTTWPSMQNRIYVNAASNANIADGRSWASAYNSLYDALQAAHTLHQCYANDIEVWVAAGTYFGDTTYNSNQYANSAFKMQLGVNVYGGFNGTESSLDQRNVAQNPTIIDGNNDRTVLIGEEAGYYIDNNYYQPTGTSVWDGITIQNGSDCGVRIYHGFTLRNCTVRNCSSSYGGGIYSSYATIENCIIEHCQSYNNGGGIYSMNSRITGTTIRDCRTIYSYNGGGIYSSNDTISHCIFYNDTASNGSAIYAYNRTTISNCLIYDNQANNYGTVTLNRSTMVNSNVVRNRSTNTSFAGVYQNDSSSIVNCIVWNNKGYNNIISDQVSISTAINCAVESNMTASNRQDNIILASDNNGIEPDAKYVAFADPDDNDFRLSEESDCINAGTANSLCGSTDLFGNPRVYDNTVDIGCYEAHNEPMCLRPSALTALASSTSAMLRWNSPSSAISTTLEYRESGSNDWSAITGLTTSSYYLTGLSSSTLYEARVSCLCDGAITSQYSDICSFSTECGTGENRVVCIGDSTNTTSSNSLPTNIYYRYSYSQQLFLSSELGGSGIINDVRFRYGSSTAETRRIKIYIATTQNETLSSSTAVNGSNMTLVYNGSVNFNRNTTWTTIPFSQPFDYDGMQNLVLIVVDSTGNYTSSRSFYTSQAGGTRALYQYSDNTIYNINQSYTSWTTTSVRNNIIFDIECPSSSCDRPLLIVDSYTDSSATLTCQTEGDLQLQYRKGTEGEFIDLTPQVSITLFNLAQASHYEVRIRRICSDGDTSAWRNLSFNTLPSNVNRLYVASQERGNGSGTSWENASGDLNWALATAETILTRFGSAPEIWVAEGTYYGGFNMRAGVKVYGGFAGNEPADYDISQRNVSAHASILDGQHQRRVLSQTHDFSSSQWALWDGFIIQNGHATNSQGGGVYMRQFSQLNNCTVRNCHASDNGGGIYTQGSSYSDNRIVISNCHIEGDTSQSYGGGVYLYGATLINSFVANNRTSNYSGGGIYSSSSTLAYNTIVKNHAATYNENSGGGIYNNNTSRIVGCILWGNTQGSGTASAVNNGTICNYCALDNNIYNDSVIHNWMLVSDNAGSLYSPMFVNPDVADGDWHLGEGSICVNRGSDSIYNAIITSISTAPAAVTTDLDGNQRIQQGHIDLGCFESNNSTLQLPVYDRIVYVKPTSSGVGDGTSWNNATDNLNDAQFLAAMNGCDVWVAQGTYYGGFNIHAGVNVYGGFNGDESASFNIENRDLDAHASILDGADSMQVLVSESQSSSNSLPSIWDGFTVRKGFGNNGGGIYLGNNGKTTINRFIVTNCNASNYGGGIYANGSHFTISNSIVNADSANYGGGIYIENGRIENCLVANNTARWQGGGIQAYNANIYGATVVHNLITNNDYDYNGAGIYMDSYSSHISNSIVWGNREQQNSSQVGGSLNSSTFRYCAIELCNSFDNLSQSISLSIENEGSVFSPRFVQPSSGYGHHYNNGEWTLTQGSICINRGNSSYQATLYDLAHNSRIQNDTVDLGCYESPYYGKALPDYGNIIYVKNTASGSADGSSWSNAMDDINNALNIAKSFGVKNVWVAEGVYLGNEQSNNAFTILPGINVYGGFAGNEPADYDLSQRDFDTHTSILDGNNVRRVLNQNSHFSSTTTATWNGFTIRNGNANNTSNGGGAYLRGHTNIVACTFENNNGYYGGAIYVDGGSFTNTVYDADSNKISYYDRTIHLADCKIRNNNAYYGGGLYGNYVSMVGCLFEGNSAYYYGGGVYSSYAYIINTTIVGNNSQNSTSGGLYGSGLRLVNSIVWGNKQGYYSGNFSGSFSTAVASAIENYSLDTNIVNLAAANDGSDLSLNYVRFNDPAEGDYSLHASSQCINIGNDSLYNLAMLAMHSDYYNATSQKDLAGNSRFMGSAIDLGCYETDANTDCPSVMDVRVFDTLASSATVTWTPGGNESQWVVRLRMDDGTFDSTFVSHNDTVTLTGLLLNRNYNVSIRALCDEQSMSFFSIPAHFTTDCDPSTLAPLPDFSSMSPINNETIHNNTIVFTWAAMANATSYDFYFWKASDSEPSEPTLKNLTSASCNYTIPDFSQNHGSLYNWRVVAWNECLSKTSQIMTVQQAHLPNLHVSAFSTSTPRAGQAMTVEWTVTNDGQGATPPGAEWNDYIWVSGHSGVGGGFLYNVDEVLLASVPNLQQLLPGQSYTNSTTVQLPQDYVGDFFFFAFADQYSANNINLTPTGSENIPLPYTPSTTGSPYPYLQSQTTSYPGNFIHSRVEETLESDNFFYIQQTILPPPTPDLTTTNIQHPLNAFSGDTIKIKWQTTNQGDASATGAWSDAVYISDNATFSPNTSTLLGTSTFDGTLMVNESYTDSITAILPISLLTGDYYIFICNDAGNQLYENIYETNNTVSSSQTMAVTMSMPADLAVQAVSSNRDTMSTLGSYTISYSVANVGLRPTGETNWRDVAYLSPTINFDNTTARQIGQKRQNRNMDINDIYNETMQVTIPDSIDDMRYIIVRTDVDNNVFEYTYEDNNTLADSDAVRIYPPDLTVHFDGQYAAVDANRKVTLSWVVANNGGDISNRRIMETIECNNQTVFSETSYYNLPNGYSTTRTAEVVIPCTGTDTAVFTVMIDNMDRIFESDETNNTATTTIHLATPDLTVSDLVLPDTMWSGRTYDATYTVTNNGSAPVDAVITDLFAFGDANTWNGSFARHTRLVQLAAGESKTESVQLTIPNGSEGLRYIHLVTNAGDSICEGYNLASNHTVAGSSQLQLTPYPDLVVTTMELPTDINIGQGLSMDYTIKNQGIAPIYQRAAATKFYISQQSSLNLNNAMLIGSDQQQLNLDIDDSATFGTLLRIPTNINTGLYYLYAVVDPDNEIYEHTYGESNNVTRSKRFSVNQYPLDLTASALTGNDNVEWGNRYTYTLTVSNNASVPTLANIWYDRLYLSEDNTLQASDQLIGSIYHNQQLDAQDSYNVNFTVDIAFGTQPVCYLIAIADATSNNPDMDMNNNVLVKQISVSSVPTADLVMSNAEIIGNVISGQPAQIAYTVTNNSNVDIDSKTWTDKIFLSYNNTYESTDQEIGSTTKRQFSLAAGSSYRDTASFIVPLPLYGEMNIIARANSGGNFYENNTDNNNTYLPVTVSIPQPGDLVVRDIIMEDTIVSGQTIHVSWNVKNIGNNSLSGNNLRSLAYLSTDQTFDANDKLLGNTSSSNVVLAPGAEVGQGLSNRISGLPEGEYYIIVKTDVSNSFNETDDDNNSSVSLFPFTLTVRELTFNTPLADTLFNNLANDYKLNVGDNTDETVRIYLTSEDTASGAVNMIYVAHNTIASNLNYDLSTIDQAVDNPELYIPATDPGYYGISTTGSTSVAVSQPVVIEADILPFELRRVTPDAGGNTGNVTVELIGSRFQPSMQVSLTNENDTIVPVNFVYGNYYSCFVTFDLNGRNVGTYDVNVVNSTEGVAVLNDGFRIEAGQPDNLYTNLLIPQSPRPNRTVVMTLEYVNAGNTDIANPMVQVNSIGESSISLTNEGLADGSTSLLVSLQPEEEVPGILRPGASGTVSIYCHTDGTMIYSVEQVENTWNTGIVTEIKTHVAGEGYQVRPESCSVGNDGVATIDVDDPELAVLWTYPDNQTDTSRTITGLAHGTYHVKVYQRNNPDLIVSQNYVSVDYIDTCNILKPVLSAVSYSQSCDIPEVEFYISAIGGVAPYYYSWANRYLTYSDNGRYTLVCNVYDAVGHSVVCERTIYIRRLQCSQDPNEIKGPEGWNDTMHYVAASEKMMYNIAFENDPDFATAPATRVSISYPIPASQDVSTFRLGDFGFGDNVFSVPQGSAYYSRRLDVSQSLGVWVDVTAGIDITSRRAFWVFQSIDPQTGFEPASSQMGFLPVNDTTGSGEGYVSFTITPAQDVQTGDTVNVDATIVFDDNAPISTNHWKNTFDAVAPASALTMTRSENSNNLSFSFMASDDMGGTGVDRVELYTSVDDGAYTYYASCPADSSLAFVMDDGKMYKFISLAIDHTGNREAMKDTPDTVINNSTAPTDILLSSNFFYENASVGSVVGRLSSLDNDITLPFQYALVSGDGDNDNALFSIEGGQLRTASSFSCNGKLSYNVRIRTTDITNLSYEKSFVISVIQENFTKYTPLDHAICQGDAYTFANRSLSLAGTYSDTLATTLGCDSIVTLQLTVNPTYSLQETHTVCDSFTWHGNTYTSSTNTPEHLYSTALGCDSLITLNLTVNHSNSAIESVDICDSYTWHGETYTASTSTPTFTSTNDAGCDSVTTLNLTVRNSNTGIHYADVCDSYTWHGNTYTASNSTATFIEQNTAGCDSTVTLNLTVRHSTSAIETETACDTYTWHGDTYTASTSTPTFTTSNAAGCDSVVTLHLTVSYSNSATEQITACDTYTWHGETYTASTSTPTFTTTNAAGCDSITTLNLTVNMSNSGIHSVDVCDSYTWHGNTYTASNSTATFVEQNTAGCDSTVTLNLTVRHSTSADTAATVCDTYTWHGETYTASTSTPTFTTTNAAGCDSVVTLHLTVNYSNSDTEQITACDTYTWHGETYTASTSTPTFTTTNAAGCDSVVTLHLTVNYSNSDTEQITACDSYTWHGETYTASTSTPTFTTTNAAGCDSTVTLQLTINYSTETTVADTAQNSYTWNGTTYTESGTYTWNGMTADGCDSTVTLMLVIEQVGINTTSDAAAISIYPNPTTGRLTIQADDIISVEVYDPVGRRVALFKDSNVINLENLATGTYTLRIKRTAGTSMQRVIIKR